MTERPVRGAKVAPSVTAEGKPLAPGIAGVLMKRLPPIEDERGAVVEVFRHEWGLSDDPLVYAYAVTVRPGRVKGWQYHAHQDDRIFHSLGTVRWALFDNRPDSDTYRKLDTLVFSERNRHLVIIPAGVVHAVQNIGPTDALFLNMPTRPYDHADPDKYRLPLNNDLIPFSFDGPAGW